MLPIKSKAIDKYSILQDSFHFYCRTLRLSLPYSFIASLFIFALPLLFSIQAFFVPSITLTSEMLILTALCWLVGSLFFSALLFRLYCAFHNLKSDFFHSLEHAFLKSIPLILLSLLYFLIILSMTMLLILPGLILMVSLSFSFILIITGNQNVFQTLLTSHRLVWGNWWHTAFLTLFMLLLNLAFSLSLTACILMLHQTFDFPLALVYCLIFLSHTFLQACFIPFAFATNLTLLQELLNRQPTPISFTPI